MTAPHIRRGSLAVAVLGVIAGMAGFAASADADPGPTLTVVGSGTSRVLRGTGFTPGSTVFLGAYHQEGGELTLVHSDSVTAGPDWVEICSPDTGVCHTIPNLNAGRFRYTLPGALTTTAYCFGDDEGFIWANDSTLGWANSIYFPECIY